MISMHCDSDLLGACSLISDPLISRLVFVVSVVTYSLQLPLRRFQAGMAQSFRYIVQVPSLVSGYVCVAVPGCVETEMFADPCLFPQLLEFLIDVGIFRRHICIQNSRVA